VTVLATYVATAWLGSGAPPLEQQFQLAKIAVRKQPNTGDNYRPSQFRPTELERIA
jgi:hypothetical protein